MNEHPEEPQFEILAPTAIEAMERANIDMRIATAHRYPRSMAAFKKSALDMALIDEETAESCIYCRPVGMKDGKQQYAEGFSVRLAEIVAASYGNLEVGSFVVEQTPRSVKCRGMAHDLEKNYKSGSECVESTVTKRGEPFSENMRTVVAKACLAKAWRDALFKVVPKALCKPIETEIRKLMLGDAKSLQARRNAVMQWVTKLGIDVARVFAALEIVGEEDIGADHLMLLTGLKNAIKDGDTSIDDAFPPVGHNPDGAPKFVPKTKVEPKSEPKAAKVEHAPEPETPKEPVAAPQSPESHKAAPKAPDAPQQPNDVRQWRDFVVPGRSPDYSGKKLGSFSPEIVKRIQDEYLIVIDWNAATPQQKMLKVMVQAAMDELHPKSDAIEQADDQNSQGLLSMIEQEEWEPAIFLTVCKMNKWIAEARRKVQDITPAEIAEISDGWEEVTKAMAKAMQPAQLI